MCLHLEHVALSRRWSLRERDIDSKMPNRSSVGRSLMDAMLKK
jgi:hypothetical protein